MTEVKVTLTDTVAIVPREVFLNHVREIQNARQFLEDTECVGDDAFQAHVLLGLVNLLCRTCSPLECWKTE